MSTIVTETPKTVHIVPLYKQEGTKPNPYIKKKIGQVYFTEAQRRSAINITKLILRKIEEDFDPNVWSVVYKNNDNSFYAIVWENENEFSNWNENLIYED